jgi:hypothetical protein
MRMWPYFPSHNYKDILERMKQGVACCLSTLHVAISMNKPFNPILGETFQCKVKDFLIYVEQTSHHPPVFNYYVKHPNLTCFGYNAMESSTGTNSVKVFTKGKFFIKFNDGIVYNYCFPPFIMNGLTMGKRLVNFSESIVITDLVIYVNV